VRKVNIILKENVIPLVKKVPSLSQMISLVTPVIAMIMENVIIKPVINALVLIEREKNII
jgi:hypothetical protein